MESNKLKKLMKIYNQRGILSTFAAILFGTIKKFSEQYRERKEIKIVKRITHCKKEIIVNVNDYKMILNGEKQGIHRELIVNHIRENQATKEMQQCIKKEEVILEAGANIGYYALMESKLVGDKGLIYAVEPAKDNFDYLIRNIKENKFKNVYPYKLAMGEKNGEALLNIYDAENWNTIADIPYAPKRAQEKILVQSVDKFLKGKKKPTFIRMDVEGYEYEIFGGMKELLKKHPPRGMFVEVHFYILGEEKSLKLLNLLKNSGYEVKKYFIDKKPFPRIFFLDYILERLEKIKDKLPTFYGEVKNVTIDDLIKNKNNLGSGSPEIFFELKNKKNAKKV